MRSIFSIKGLRGVFASSRLWVDYWVYSQTPLDNRRAGITIEHPVGLEQIVNLEEYPITEPGSSRAALVAKCRSNFLDDVLCELPGFLRPEAVEAVVASVESRRDRAHSSSRYRRAYKPYAPLQDNLPAWHSTLHRRHCAYLAYDEFEPGSVLPALYQDERFIGFAAEVLGLAVLYPAADPLVAVCVTLHESGSEVGWHYDTQSFTVTAMFRPSDEGGIFEYVPQAGPGDGNYERVPEVFDNDRTLVRTVSIKPGSIVLFRGDNTLHRVTPTKGETYRILSTFLYEETPGRVYPDGFKLDLFGRTQPYA